MRPDIIDAVREVARRAHRPNLGHCKAAINILEYPDATKGLSFLQQVLGFMLPSKKGRKIISNEDNNGGAIDLANNPTMNRRSPSTLILESFLFEINLEKEALQVSTSGLITNSRISAISPCLKKHLGSTVGAFWVCGDIGRYPLRGRSAKDMLAIHLSTQKEGPGCCLSNNQQIRDCNGADKSPT